MLLLRSLVICHWFVILPPWLSLIKTRDKCFSKQELHKAPLLSSSKRNIVLKTVLLDYETPENMTRYEVQISLEKHEKYF